MLCQLYCNRILAALWTRLFAGKYCASCLVLEPEKLSSIGLYYLNTSFSSLTNRNQHRNLLLADSCDVSFVYHRSQLSITSPTCSFTNASNCSFSGFTSVSNRFHLYPLLDSGLTVQDSFKKLTFKGR